MNWRFSNYDFDNYIQLSILIYWFFFFLRFVDYDDLPERWTIADEDGDTIVFSTDVEMREAIALPSNKQLFRIRTVGNNFTYI